MSEIEKSKVDVEENLKYRQKKNRVAVMIIPVHLSRKQMLYETANGTGKCRYIWPSFHSQYYKSINMK